MKTISIVNRKGGTGKTNIAYNLAVELSQKHKVLMIDLDPQMDLTYTSNLIMKTKLDILDVLYNNATVVAAAVTLKDNLEIIKGNENINHYEKTSNGKDLEQKLLEIDDVFDYVIIDYPPTLLEIGIAGISASDQAIIVTEPERLAFKNIDAMIEDLVAINEEIDIRILINKVDMRRNVTKVTLNKLKLKYPNKLFDQHVSVSTAFPNTNNKKMPLRKLNWWPKVLTQLRKVMKEIVKEEE